MRYRILIRLFLIAAILAVFWPLHNYDFSWDDRVNIYENPYLTSFSLSNTLVFWQESYRSLYIPLTYSIWSILSWFSQFYPLEPYGQNPHIYHSANIIFHVLNTLLVFSILKIVLTRFVGDEKNSRISPQLWVDIGAGFGALTFAIHPIQVEVVSWNTGMKDLLCGIMVFTAIRGYLLFAIASRDKEQANSPNHASSTYITFQYILASVAFTLALLAKPVAVMVPAVLLILDLFVVKRPVFKSATALAGWFMLSVLFAFITKSAQQSVAMEVVSPLWARPFIAGDAVAFYIYKLVLPLQLGIDYGRNPAFVLQQWWIYVTWLVPLVLIAGASLCKNRKLLFVAIGIFLVFLFPVLGFVPFIFQITSTVADRYLYIPLLGVGLMVSWIIVDRKSIFLILLIFPVIMLFAVRSSSQLQTWKNDYELYVNAIKVNPDSIFAYYGLGTTLVLEGKFKESLPYFYKALPISRNPERVHSNIGAALVELGKMDEAASHFNQAIKLTPDDIDLRNNLVVVLFKQGKRGEAIYNLKAITMLQPGDVKVLNRLGIALAEQGELEEAEKYYKRAIRIQPDFADVYINLGINFGKQGKLQEALNAFNKAISYQPDNVRAYVNLGITLKLLKKPQEAVAKFKKAIELQPDDAVAHYNLGIVLSNQGKQNEAVFHYSEALRIQPDFENVKRRLEIALSKSRGGS